MKPQEANKIIAEYMGFTVWCKESELLPASCSHIREDFIRYSKSLDTLVPVWEKLENWVIDHDYAFWKIGNHWTFSFESKHAVTNDYIKEAKGKTIQEAAAIATAKAIQEIEK